MQQGQDGKFVLVVEDGKAIARAVEVGPWIGEDWVIEKGLNVRQVEQLVRETHGNTPEEPAAAAPPIGTGPTPRA